LHPAVTARLAPWRETFWHYHTRLRHYEQAMRALPQQPLVYTHGDAGGNVVANDAHNLHLIDWDYIGLSEPERDLWVFEFYPDFVAGYQSIIPSYQPNEVRLQYAAYRQFFDYLVYFLSALHATPVADDPTHTIDNLLSLFTDWCQPHMR
jgi:aminoglycoside phosphotransferase (APT) family kinase protein